MSTNREELLREYQEYNETLLRNIRKYCAVMETSIPKIEKQLGYGNGSISGWKNAKKKAPQERVEAVAKLLNVSVGDLIAAAYKTGAESEKQKMLTAQSDELQKELKEYNDLILQATPENRKIVLSVLRGLVSQQEETEGKQ